MQCSSVREKTLNTFARRYDSTDTRFCKQLSILDAPAFSTLAFSASPCIVLYCICSTNVNRWLECSHANDCLVETDAILKMLFTIR